MEINELLKLAVEKKASDLLLRVPGHDEAINNCRSPELFQNTLNKEPKKNKAQEVIYNN